MIKRQTGFTLIELLITMAIIGLVLGAISDMFIGLLRQYKQQTKISETSIEGLIGLELLRRDIENAGYGLPWVIPSGLTYNEATETGAAPYNDAPSAAPRPILSENIHDAGWSDGTNDPADLLVIKSTNIARNAASERWTYLTTGLTHSWDSTSENPDSGDRVIVLSPGSVGSDVRTLVTVEVGNQTAWSPLFSGIPNFLPAATDPQPRYVYSIFNGAAAARMPFNRADYHVSRTAVPVPARCAPNTGVLVKSMIGHSGANAGRRSDHVALLDCVADMKAIFRLDYDGDGLIDDPVSDNISALTAEQIRTQVKEVRVYILAHQGQMDRNYTHPETVIKVGDERISQNLMHRFNIGANVNYRWKLYTIVVQPKNMRQ